MFKLPAHALIVFALFFSCAASAFTANGTIKGGELTWDNVFSRNGNLTLSDWSTVAGLPPTVQWSPGAGINSTSSITLTGPAESVDVSVSLQGMEYNVGGVSATKDSSFVSVGQQCSGGDFDGSIAWATGASATPCSAPFSLTHTSSVAPFYFYRPLFNFDDEALMAALDGKDAGNYVGTMPVTVVYYYISSGGAHTYYQLQESLSFQINYIPSYLTSIDVTNGNINGAGLGEMIPEYDTTNFQVSSSTIFDIKATGYFAEGLSMDFTTQTDYYLVGADSGIQIPYSITCDDCDDPQIVTDGSRNVDTTVIQASSDKKVIDFKYNVHYDNISASDVASDSYAGSFVVIFEEVI